TTMTGCRQQKPKLGLTKCPDLVDHYNLLKPANGGELRARTSLTRFMPREKIRPDSQFCRALLAIGLTSP
ncbi:hypothetical protein, partial [Aeromonas veronii]|uniref:hypothetical protein n=1 Tax=Aeromonas veronii TaxID=654 RepID=UPI003D1EAD9D